LWAHFIFAGHVGADFSSMQTMIFCVIAGVLEAINVCAMEFWFFRKRSSLIKRMGQLYLNQLI
jgi:hypothetical protein